LDLRRGASFSDGYLQHVKDDGSIVAGWPANGLPISVTGFVGRIRCVSDGGGGVLVFWTESPARDLWVQRIDGNGSVHAGWPPAGMLIDPNLYNSFLEVATDEAGGAYVATLHSSNPELIAATVTRVGNDGAYVAPFTQAGVGIGGDNDVTSCRIEAD